MNNNGLLLIFSGPSGAGKGTVLKELLNGNDNMKLSVSATTRTPREGECHGVHYFFMTKEEIESNCQRTNAGTCGILRKVLRNAKLSNYGLD